MKSISIKLLSAFIFSLIATASLAQTKHEKFTDWTVYTTLQNQTKLCYMVSKPIKETGTYTKRGLPYVMVTSISGKKEEISATSGYPYKAGTEPRLIIDGIERKLSLTQGETAWFKSSNSDENAIIAMKKGYTMKIKGTSPKDTYSIDSYSLKGFSAAYRKMIALCK